MKKVNTRLLPVKAHFFCFMASVGPILPFLNVFGKQLGVSEVVMGSVTAVLPILFLIAKPLFGMLVDYFQDYRKAIFMMLIGVQCTAYVLLYFVPFVKGNLKNYDVNLQCGTHNSSEVALCGNVVLCDSGFVACNWTCLNYGEHIHSNFSSHVRSTSSIHGGIYCFYPYDVNLTMCDLNYKECTVTCKSDNHHVCATEDDSDVLYSKAYFWLFVIFMSIGTIGFNVINSISDAICFDVLGEHQQMKYGNQRVWGTIGFGLTAALAGLGMDLWSDGMAVKDYTPAFIIIAVFTFFDLLCCVKLKLPILPKSENIIRDVGTLIKHTHIAAFLMFAILAGVVDGFLIYYMFWFLEDLANITGHMTYIKLLEGLVVAAETLCGEVIFFSLSGRILKKIGYGHSLTVCFLSYSLRLILISLIPSPWWLLPIELFMQGPTYALCYTTIVAYASAVSPPGTSATMQGLVAGVDDGLGYAIGSLTGGLAYKYVGQRRSFQLFGAIAAVCAVIHHAMYIRFFKKTMIPAGQMNESSAEYRIPKEAADLTVVAEEQSKNDYEENLQQEKC